MWAGIDAAWRAAYALALIASRCLLTDDWDLDLAFFSESIFLAVHRNVSIGAIARTETAAYTVVLMTISLEPSRKMELTGQPTRQ